MKLDNHALLLYAVTDQTWTGQHTLLEQVEQAILGGVTFVQLREKQIPYEEFVQLATDIKQITDKHRIPFVINDNIEVALAVDADGVHMGQDDLPAQKVRARIGPNKILGISAHTLEEALQAEQNGADYIGVGAVFTTTSKLDANAVTLDTLRAICRAVSIPVVAIGGIHEHNIGQLQHTGIDGVAVISAIFAKSDIVHATQHLRALAEQVIYPQDKE